MNKCRHTREDFQQCRQKCQPKSAKDVQKPEGFEKKSINRHVSLLPSNGSGLRVRVFFINLIPVFFVAGLMVVFSMPAVLFDFADNLLNLIIQFDVFNIGFCCYFAFLINSDDAISKLQELNCVKSARRTNCYDAVQTYWSELP